MFRSILAATCVATILVALAHAGQLHVPGDYDDLQEAIDNALAGDTIIVHGGTFDPITIDKPLTIVGEPRPTIRFDVDTSPDEFRPAHMRLLGPGSGVVVLRNLQVGPGNLRFSQTRVDPAITASGFDELHIHDSHIQAAYFFVPGGDCCFDGKAALSTSIPQIFISHSTLLASPSDTGVCNFLPEPPQAGIAAPSSTVVLMDSQVTGGGQAFFCTPDSCLDPDIVKSEHLAPGIAAASLFRANSEIQGGTARFWGFQHLPGGTVMRCGDGPQADPLDVVQYVEFPTTILAFTDLALGRTWVLIWSASGSFSTLFLSTDALLPPALTSTGWLFLDFQGALPPRTVFGPGTHQFRFTPHPGAISLIGVEVVAQVFDSGPGLSRPISDCVGPLVVPSLINPPVSK